MRSRNKHNLDRYKKTRCVKVANYAHVLMGRSTEDNSKIVYKLFSVQYHGKVNIVPIYSGHEKPKKYHYVQCWAMNKLLFVLNLFLAAYAAFVVLPLWLVGNLILLVGAVLTFNRGCINGQIDELNQLYKGWK
jgi:hypothetical protein